MSGGTVVGMQVILAKGRPSPQWWRWCWWGAALSGRGVTARHAPLASEQLLLDNVQGRKPLVLIQSTVPALTAGTVAKAAPPSTCGPHDRKQLEDGWAALTYVRFSSEAAGGCCRCASV